MEDLKIPKHCLAWRPYPFLYSFNTMIMDTEVRLGIIGLGNMGNYYARAILEGEGPGLQLSAVCDMD